MASVREEAPPVQRLPNNDKELLHQVLAKADCLVENFKPGVMAKVCACFASLFDTARNFRWAWIGTRYMNGIRIVRCLHILSFFA